MMLSQLDSPNTGLWLLLFVLVMVTGSLWILRRRTHRQPVTRMATREKLDRVREQSQMRRSMDELLLQLEDLSRRINAHVDTKFVKLETVVRDADDRIRRLEQLLAQARTPAQRPTTPSTAAGVIPPIAVNRSSGNGTESSAVGHDSPTNRPTASPTPQMPNAAATTSPTVFEPLTPQHRRIFELADQGSSAAEIAESLNVMLGEVELVLNLRNVK